MRIVIARAFVVAVGLLLGVVNLGYSAELAYRTLASTIYSTDNRNHDNEWVNDKEAGYSGNPSLLTTHVLYPYPQYSVKGFTDGFPRPKAGARDLQVGAIPLIIVHGWQGKKGLTDPAKLAEEEGNSAEAYWAKFLAYFEANPSLANKFQIYLYKYPSYKHVTYNARVLKDLIGEVDSLASRRVLFIAHSMGGLVTRSLIEEHGFGDATAVITLATPHHGTPGAMRRWIDLANLADAFVKDVDTPGANDLYWDNYDGIMEWAQGDMAKGLGGRLPEMLAFDGYWRDRIIQEIPGEMPLIVSDKYSPILGIPTIRRFQNTWLSYLNENIRINGPSCLYINYGGYNETVDDSHNNNIIDDPFYKFYGISTGKMYDAGYTNDMVVPVTSGFLDFSKHDGYIRKGHFNPELDAAWASPWKIALFEAELLNPPDLLNAESFIYWAETPNDSYLRRFFKDFHHDRMLNDVAASDYKSPAIRQEYLSDSPIVRDGITATHALFDTIWYDLEHYTDHIPSKPTLQSPPNGVAPTAVPFSWTPSSCTNCGTVTYNLEIHKDGLPVYKADLEGGMVPETSRTISNRLQPNTTYWWTVFPKSQYGVWNLDAQFFSFTTGDGVSNAAPVARFDVLPAQGDSDTLYSFDAGSSTDPDGTSLAYSWDWGEGAGFGAWSASEVTSHQFSGPGNWRVTLRARDQTGWVAQTTTTLYVRPRPGPPPPTRSPTPADEAQWAPLDLILTWRGADGATSFDVFVGTTAALGPADFQRTETVPSHRPLDLVYGATYYWRVDASNALGTTTGPVWSFTTPPPPAWLAYHYWDFDTDGSEGWTARNGTSDDIFDAEYWVVNPGPDLVSPSGIISAPGLTGVHTNQFDALEVRAAVKDRYVPELQIHLWIDGTERSPFPLSRVAGEPIANSQILYRGSIPHSGRIDRVRIDFLDGSDAVDDRLFVDRITFLERADPIAAEVGGTVRDPSGAGVPGVAVVFSCGAGTATTDPQGRYRLPVTPGWSGTLTPGRSGYGFEPASAAVPAVSAPVVRDFLAQPPAGQASMTFVAGDGGLSDGFAYANGFDYAPAQAAATATDASHTPYNTLLSAGQDRAQSGEYFVFRAAIPFDTSALPDDATLTGAELHLYGYDADYSTTDFVLDLVPSGQADPAQLFEADFGSFGTLSGGELHTASWQGRDGVNAVALNATGLGWVDPAGTTLFGLRSRRDVAAQVPTGPEFVNIWAGLSGTAYAPKLVVHYVPVPVPDDPPAGSIVVAGGAAYATSPNVTLQLAATDDHGPVAEMAFSNDGASWSAWRAYAASASWTLSADDGPKTVYARFRDGGGNLSPVVSAGITLDATPPTAAVNLAGGSYFGVQQVSLTCSETGPIHYTLDDTAPSAASTLYAGALRLRQSATLRALCVDPAGNVGPETAQAYTIRGVSVLYGRVFDMATGQAIINATISSPFWAYGTDVRGEFEIEATPGIFTVTIAKAGYQTLTRANVLLLEGRSTRLDVAMVPPGVLTIATPELPPAEVGTHYNERVRLSGGAWPYGYRVASGALPPGLALEPATGNVAGTPTQAGSFDFAVGVNDALGAYAERSFTVVVTAPLQVVGGGALSPGTVGWGCAQPLTAAGGQPPYAFSVVAGAVPVGVTLTSGGSLAGTPSAAGAYAFTARATDFEGRWAEADFSVAVAAALHIDTERLADGLPGRAYNQALAAGGGNVPYTWGLYAGLLPAGLTVTEQGMVTGVAAEPTAGTVVFWVHDSDGRETYRGFTLRVAEPLSVATAQLPDALLGQLYSEAVRVRGGVSPLRFQLTGQLLAGLGLDDATGVISGTPTQGGFHNLGVRVSDSTWPTAQTAEVALTLRVGSELTVLTSALLPSTVQGETFATVTLAAAGGPGPYTWQHTAGFLPASLALDGAAGQLAGTASAAGDYAFELEVTDALGATARKTFYAHVAQALRFTTHVLPDPAAGIPYSQALGVTGGTPPYAWRLVSGALPSGLALDQATGTLAGRAVAAQLATTFTVEVSDASTPAQSAQQSYTVQVLDDLTVLAAELPNGRQDQAYTAVLRAAGGWEPYVWRLESGVLPPGLALVSVGGEARLEGTPTPPGTYPFSLEVADSGTPVRRVVRAYDLTIYGTVAIDTAALPSALHGLPYSQTLAASGGSLPHRWQVVQGALPAGLQLNPATGAVGGVPNLVVGQSSLFRVRVTDAGDPAGFDERTYAVHVIDELQLTTTELPGARQLTAYGTTLQGQGGVSPYTWTVSSGALPQGLALDPAAGVLSGTPEACGSFGFTVQLTDAAQLPNTATRTFELAVQCPTGFLAVTLEPSQVVAAGARWSADGGVNWHASGASVELPAGTHTVTFGEQAGWTAPAAQNVTLSADATLSLTGTYVEILPLAEISGGPSSPTNQTAATFRVGGTAVAAYRYNLDGSGYAAETPISTPITLTGLGAGEHMLSVIGRNPAGTWQSEAAATTHTWTIVAEALHWDGVVYTPFVADYYGALTVGGQPAAAGDEVAVFDPDGVLCGHTVVGTEGAYGLMHVYGDDPSTPAVDEGAESGDTLTFKVWSVSAQKEYPAYPTVVSGTAEWFAGEQNNVDLNAIDRVTIPLRAGWNLVSVPVAACWEKGSAPSVALPTGTEHQTVTSIADVFSSIAGKYTVVRSFDAAGAHTFDPNLPDFFNDLTYVAGGYGYWVKMLEDADLTLEGAPLAPTATLDLSAGWNLVGYWGASVQHVGSAPTGHFPAGTAFTPVDSIADVVPGLAGNLVVLRSFDAAGAHTYDPTLPDFFNDLNYVGPGYGYWVKLNADGELGYDAP